MKKFVSLLLVGIISVTSFVSGVSADSSNISTGNIIQSTQNKQTQLIIYKNGVLINGKYYSKKEFTQLLQKAEKISTNHNGVSTRAAFLAAIPAGEYVIAGIGTIVITHGREIAITIGGAVVQSGTWLYDRIINALQWMFSSSVADAYNKAKKDKQPTNNHSQEYGRNLPGKWEPNSSKDLIENGKVKQRRYYDENGDAQLDVDYFHQDSNNSHTFPHCHDWINGKRSNKWYTC